MSKKTIKLCDNQEMVGETKITHPTKVVELSEVQPSDMVQSVHYLWDTRDNRGVLSVVILNDAGDGFYDASHEEAVWYFEDNLVGKFYGPFIIGGVQ